MKKTFGVLLTVLLISPTSIIASTNWKMIYKDALIDIVNNEEVDLVDRLSLVDIDLDGIPELFGGSYSKTYCPTEIALSIKDDKLIKLKDVTNGLCGIPKDRAFSNSIYRVGFEGWSHAKLYRNKNTNTYKWIATDHISSIDHYNSFATYELSLKGAQLTSNRISYQETSMVYSDSGDIQDVFDTTYVYRDKEVEPSVYEKESIKYFNSLEPIDFESISMIWGYDVNPSKIDEFFDSYKFIPLPKQAHPSTQQVMVDGKEFKLQAYKIDNYNYFKLRDLANILNHTPSSFDIIVDSSDRISIHQGTRYTPNGTELKIDSNNNSTDAKISNQKIFQGMTSLPIDLYLIKNNNYVKLRDITEFINIQVEPFSPNTIKITTKN